MFLIKIFIGTIPIIPVGYFLYKTNMIEQLRSLEIVAWMSLLFGILLYLSDRSKTLNKINTNFTNKSAIVIGLFQVLRHAIDSLTSQRCSNDPFGPG